MKNLLNILSLLLCFELIVGPLNISLLTADIAHAEETTCPTGQTFNTSVNRCLTSAEVIRVNNATQSCGTNKECYKKNAQDELNKSVEDGDVESHNNAFFKDDEGRTRGWTKGLNAFVIAIPLLILIKTMVHRSAFKKDSGFRCRPASLMLMYGAAAVLGTGEIITSITHSRALKKMKERWNDIVVPESTAGKDDMKAQATEAQSQAFEFLAQNEDSVAKTAKTKFGFYVTATSLFAAGALMATVEIFLLRAAKKKAAAAAIAAKAPLTAAAGTTALLAAQQEIAALTCGSQLETKSKKEGEEIYDKFKPKTNSSFFLKDLDPMYEKAKIVAAKNIATAKNVEDLLELTREFQSIEFENYSRTSYFEDININEFKSMLLEKDVSSIVSNLFIEQALAVSFPEDEDKKDKKTNAGDLLGQGVGMLGGLKNIVKGLKFQGGTPITQEQVTKIDEEMDGWLSKFFYSPTTRVGINVLLGGWMGLMSHHMKEQQKKSEARAAKLREIKTEFASANGLMNCKSEDRDDPSKPKCYCFTADNKPNPARGSSKICATNFAELNTGVNGNNITTLKTCVDENYNLDPKCGCKNKKGADGKSSCLKATSGINFKGFNPGTFRMLSAGAGPGNDILSGNLAAGSMDSASVSANAAKIRAAADDMLKKMDPNLGNQIKGMSAGMEKSLLATGSGLSMPGLANNAALPSNPKEAANALEKEMKEETAPEVTKTAGGSAAPSSGGEAQPEFGLTEEQLAAQESEVAEVMGQEMDMGNNDINSGEKTNLFDVLSNRYKRSGMRRLFDEEGKTKADAPSNSDVAP